MLRRGEMALLAGKTALVTGAARRVGRAISLSLAAEGARCVLHYNRSAEDVAATAEACRRLGVEALPFAADLAAGEGLALLAELAVTERVDVLIHNASTFSRTPFEAPVEEHQRILERDLRLHVTVPWILGCRAGTRMAEAGWGRIVVLGDWSTGAAAYLHYGPYQISKAAVPTLVRVLALELGRKSPGVTVNAILPGPLLPPEGRPPAEFERVADQTILRGWIGTGDVVEAVRYFVTASGVTGETLRIDGGRAVRAL